MQRLTTTLVSCTQKLNHHHVVLKENLFYPTGGGQPHDLGSLNGEPILDVFEEDGVIYHVLANPPSSPEVDCVLDWARRFDHMQQHTGQHLLSAVFADSFKYETESFHLGEEYSSIDITAKNLSRLEHVQVEQQVEELILLNLPIFTYEVAETDLATLPLRKRPAVEGNLRIVEIEGRDYSPCSGTHLQTTGQLQLLKIINIEKYKGQTRVYFLTGNRALQDYSKKHEITSTLVSLVGVPPYELNARWQQQNQVKRDLERRLQILQEQLLHYEAREIVGKAEGDLLLLKRPQATIQEGQNLINAILNLSSLYVMVQLQDRLVLGHNLHGGLNLGQLIKDVAIPQGGKGGGSATSAQVYFANDDDLQKFTKVLFGLLGESRK